MIKGCNDASLAKMGIDEKYYLLYQIWKELTEPKTLDSYQYRVTNTLSGIRELSQVITNRLNGYSTTNHSIDDCKIELLGIVKTDLTLKRHFYTIWKRLMAHLSEKTDSSASQKALHHQLDYCYSEISDKYFLNLVDDLRDSINEQDNIMITNCASCLVSCCVTNGWSTQALNSIVNVFLNSKENPEEAWESFKGHIIGRNNNKYFVYIPIMVKPKNASGLPKAAKRENFHRELESLGISVIGSDTLIEKAGTSNDSKQKIQKNMYYMEVEVYALDFYAASHKAINICSESMSILSFFNVIEAWNISILSWITYDDTYEHYKWIRYADLYGTYDYLEGANRLIDAAKKIKNRDTIVQKRLLSAFGYANMGKASSAQEEQFINTWVALESLCHGDAYDNIISNVLETVPPALCSRYIYKLFRNFVEDCLRCELSLSFMTGRYNVDHDNKEECVKKIIQVFRDDELYAELYNKCSVNSLLKMRCEELKKMVNDETGFLTRIERHFLNVRLQLSRLYRIRNEIAHNALNANGSILIYIEHLDDYLAGVVAEIIMISEKKGIDDIEVIFEIIKDNYTEFLDIIKPKKGTNAGNLLKDFLDSGIIDLI